MKIIPIVFWGWPKRDNMNGMREISAGYNSYIQHVRKEVARYIVSRLVY